jgi:flagellar M-ring protein FliF
MGVLGLVVVLLVMRPLVRRVIAPEDGVLALPAGLLRDGAAVSVAAPGAVEVIKPEPSETAKMIDIAQVQGQVHAQSVQKVGELADKNPHEAVSIIRNWLHEDAA